MRKLLAALFCNLGLSAILVGQDYCVNEFVANEISYTSIELDASIIDLRFVSFQELTNIPSISNNFVIVEVGYFNDHGEHIGLLLNLGSQISPLDKAKSGYGNFYLQPNGVFMKRGDTVELLTTDDFSRTSSGTNIELAFQSGPMLIVDGGLNSVMNLASENHHRRTAIGLRDRNGSKEIILLNSEDPVNLFNFSSTLHNRFGVYQALLIGSASTALYSSLLSDTNSLPHRPFYLLIEWE